MNEFEKYIRDTLRPEVIVRPITNTSTRVLRHSYSAKKPSTRLTPLYSHRKKRMPAVIDFDFDDAQSVYNLDTIDSSYNPQQIRLWALDDDDETRFVLSPIIVFPTIRLPGSYVIYYDYLIGCSNARINLDVPQDSKNTNIHSLLSTAVLTGQLKGNYFSFFDHTRIKARPAAICPVYEGIPTYQMYFINISNDEFQRLANELEFPNPPRLKSRENILVFTYFVHHWLECFPFVENNRFFNTIFEAARQIAAMYPNYIGIKFNIQYYEKVVPGEIRRCQLVQNGGQRWFRCEGLSFNRCPYDVNVELWGIGGSVVDDFSSYMPWWGELTAEILSSLPFNRLGISLNFAGSCSPPRPEYLFNTLTEQVFLFEYSKVPKLAINSSTHKYTKVANLTYYHRSIIAKRFRDDPDSLDSDDIPIHRLRPIFRSSGRERFRDYPNSDDTDSLHFDDIANRLRTIFRSLGRVSIKIPLYVAYSHSVDFLRNNQVAISDRQIDRIERVIEKYRTRLPQKKKEEDIPIPYKEALFGRRKFMSYNFDVPYKSDIEELGIPYDEE